MQYRRHGQLSIHIPGYQQLIYRNRTNGRGGGVGYYIKDGLNVKIVDRLSPFQDKIFESLTLDNQMKHYTVTNIYRSPTPIRNMTGQQQLETFMTTWTTSLMTSHPITVTHTYS